MANPDDLLALTKLVERLALLAMRMSERASFIESATAIQREAAALRIQIGKKVTRG